jgi:parallel beta-helix repeat protein
VGSSVVISTNPGSNKGKGISPPLNSAPPHPPPQAFYLADAFLPCMYRKVAAVWVSLVMMFGFIMIVDINMDFIPIAEGTTHYVNETGSGGAFIKVQDAINASIDGDTVFVYNGTYYENIFITKKINLIGENRNSTLIDASNYFDVIIVGDGPVKITEFTIRNSGSGSFAGIHISSENDCIIEKNNIVNNGNGIYLSGNGANNLISANNISNNTIGITMEDHEYNTISKNNITYNQYGIIFDVSSTDHTIDNNSICNNEYGIKFTGSSLFNTITNNNISENINYGILFDATGYNIVNGNLIYNNSNGIYFRATGYNDISGNQIISNQNSGIYFDGGGFTTFSNNTILHNDNGIFILPKATTNDFISNNISNNNIGVNIDGCQNENVFFHNNITSNNNYGGKLVSSSNTSIYHNYFIQNGIQASDDSNGQNQWNKSYPDGGNYWSDYTGKDLYYGPNQDIPGNDAIGDTNYSIDADSIDHYPLMEGIGEHIFLYNGWNLISIPYIQSDTNLSSVLFPILGSYNAVQHYELTDINDQWKHNHVLKPFELNDLEHLNHTIGFWIDITDTPGIVSEYPGFLPTSNQTILLHPGWNMVGYPSLTSHNRTIGLNNLTFDTHIDCIQWYDAATKTWHFMDQDDSFVPGRGYWVHSKVDAEWEVPL